MPLTCTICGENRNSLDETLNAYACPVMTFAKEKKPKELVVAVCNTTPWESVIETVALRRPRLSDVNTFPSTVTSDGIGVGVGVGVRVGVGVGDALPTVTR